MPPSTTSLTVEEFVNKHATKIRSNRGGWIIPCLYPDHKDSTPSFHINWDGLFYCWGCGRKGNFATLLHDVAKWSWKKAIEHANGIRKTAVRDPLVSLEDVAPQHISRGLLALFEVDWREGYQRWILAQDDPDGPRPPWTFPFEKGFIPETLTHFDAGYDPDLQRVTIPIFGEFQSSTKGRLQGVMGRSCTDSFPKYLMYPPLKPSQHLYNAQAVTANHDTVLLVEGAWDVWMLWQKGITIPAVSLLTSKVSRAQVDQLVALNRTYVIMFDADTSGKEGAIAVAQCLLARGLKIDIGMSFPKGIADLKQLTAADIRTAYEHRRMFPAPSAYALLA